MIQLFTRILIVVLAAASSLLGQRLSPDEQKIIDYIDKHGVEAVSLLERSVNIESPTEDLAGVKNVGMLLAKELEAIGMTVKWIPMPANVKRAGHLVAETKGSKGKRLLLLGHLDTVFKGEKFRREGDIVYGTGVGDMKGGNVILIQALKALNAIGALRD